MARRKACRAEGCLLPKEPPRHFCAWHALAREPIEVQIAAMRARARAVPDDARIGRVAAHLWPPGWRWCAACQSFVPLFYATGSQCYACGSVAAHAGRIRRDYDLTAVQYDALLELQDGRCAICRAKPKTTRLAVDHDHGSGKVRGLCCVKCNHDVLGGAHDSLDILERAVHYLRNPPASGRWDPPTGPAKRALGADAQRAVDSIPHGLSAEDGYRLSGSRGAEVIYVLRSALEPPFGSSPQDPQARPEHLAS